MSGKFRLIGSGAEAEASVHTPTSVGSDEISGLVVYNHSLETGVPLFQFFSDESGAVDQNIDASAAGTLTNIHNGTDSVLWTAVAEVGTWDFASTAQANTGTKSIEITSTRDGVASFTNLSPLNVTDYSDLRFFLYIDVWPALGNKNIVVQLSLNGSAVGSTVNVSSYADTTAAGSWQLVNIPTTDFAVGTAQFDAIIVSVVNTGAGPTLSGYIDDMALVGSGTSGRRAFSIGPPPDQVWVINKIKWTAVSTSNSIKYDEFFGIPALTNGYTLSFESQDKEKNSFLVNTFFGLAQYPNVSLNIISGTNSIFEVFFDIPQNQQVLVGRLNQKISLTVQDNLSSMQKFRTTALGYVKGTI